MRFYELFGFGGLILREMGATLWFRLENFGFFEKGLNREKKVCYLILFYKYLYYILYIL